jgi:hypothetical protein
MFRPWLLAVALVLGASWLRVVYGLFGGQTDQIVVSQAAAALAWAGGNPYGVGYPESVPAGAPFAYGPLMLLWAGGGIWAEAAASIGVLILLGASRSWLTLAVIGGWPTLVDTVTVGVNDSGPGLFITAGLLMLRHSPLAGGALLAIAAGLKPYALAWFPAAIGFAGVPALLGLALASIAVWSPLLFWSPASFLKSLDLARAIHPVPENSLNMPALRILAVPIAIASLLASKWAVAVFCGAAIFVIILFLDTWASIGYLLAVLPIVGIAAESSAVMWWMRRRSAQPSETATR